MTSKNDIAGHLASEPLGELAHLLDAWGGAPTRWPPLVRERIGQIVAAEPGGQVLLANASAFNELLDRNRDTTAQVPHGLVDRIMTAALISDAGAETPTGRQTAERAPAKIITLPFRPRPQAAPTMRGQWRAAGLIAASLLLGIYIGGAVNLAPALQDLADAIGLSTEIEPVLVASGEDLNDEDTL